MAEPIFREDAIVPSPLNGADDLAASSTSRRNLEMTTESPAVGVDDSAKTPERVPEALYQVITQLLDMARETVNKTIGEKEYAHPDARASARNFAAYLAIRQEDIRGLQRDLHRSGLSSLGRMDTHALNSLEAVRRVLAAVIGQTGDIEPVESLDYDQGEVILSRRTTGLLGPRSPHRSARIMVTMPSEAATRFELVRDLIEAGMEVMRINCAHDDGSVWLALIQNARRAARELGKPCAVLCDLPGPKLRTGSIETGEGVVRWHAFKDDYGEVIEPARVWLSEDAPAPTFAHAVLPVNRAFVEQLKAGDEIHFRDHQGRTRWLVVTAVTPGGAWGEGARGAFMVRGIPLVARRDGRPLPITGAIGELPPMPREIPLKAGDLIILTPADILGCPPRFDRLGNLREPGCIGCSLPQAFSDVRPGERVFFDDGKIAGVVEQVQRERLTVRITWTRAATARLAEDKGINLPDTHLVLPALSHADLQALDFICDHSSLIDLVGLSFVRSAMDVHSLYEELDRRRMLSQGVLLKIETRAGFQNLPGIILTALKRNNIGVMIARGDLGVEVGFERMAELQEEIASLCAAAHLPVVWATQVLETLAKKGMPSRAEVSDVVLAARTQCVMLNKGPHVVAAVRFLSNVLERMEGHQDKHFRLLRALGVAKFVPAYQA